MGRHGPLGHVSSLPGRLSPHLQGWLGLVVQCYISISFFGCAGSLLLRGLFSGCRALELPSGCGVWASHCRGFSCCGAQALGHVGIRSCSSQALEHRLVSGGAWT